MHLFSQFCHRTVNEEEEIAHKLLGPQFQVGDVFNLINSVSGSQRVTYVESRFVK